MHKRWLPGALALLFVTLLAGYYWYPGSTPPEQFLAHHWAYPIPPQGRPPAEFTPLEASLDPASCGTCHTSQYRDWRSSLHSHTMGAGIAWQLRLADSETASACLRCHAPMSEQLALNARERGWSEHTAAPPAHIPADLHRQGLVCAACHLRGHTRYGPEAGDGALEGTAHNGFVAQPAFADSRFCANCHQFEADGPRLNGKLREDTYAQWQASSHAAEGRHCQDCHMPGRRHLWRGIHDREMTRSALQVTPALATTPDGDRLVRVAVTNSGAGHHLPTYLVAEVALQLEWQGGDGRVRLLQRHLLAWRADLALSRELFDQRLAAGDTVTLAAPLSTREAAGQLRLRVVVSPREHYLRTFEDYQAREGARLDATTRALLQQAIDEARAARYEFIAGEWPLAAIAK